ncbi:leucine--tRNA ligase [Methanobacterium alcaliphilum]|uniref:leucine--tRNA ligase n=1 Tax=Methanobacterium alcaliphilum TaxID=392018 RepID=UPI00200B2EC1|nr:leucine--tRNA ligase [Methanobacterium alcaliphilum]MCK9152333.1 leucine--tRNA ligase [Methanobacterium alcaliphilum]
MQKNMEIKWQKKWRESKIFQSDPDNREKIFLTVAYPYPSGAMHIGHGRTYTVPDVYARFKRMQGFNVLFPMGWHVTGAPVIGIAKRIQRQDPWTLNIYQNVHKVPEKELAKFSDPEYIVNYFSSEYHNVMEHLGFSIDWRREFRTTDESYQKFIEWQIRQLKDKGLVRRGAHPVKYCVECKNPVGDHDLLEGEGVGINELTLLKFEIDGYYLVPATFRPETIYGATNLWLNPEVEYFKVKTCGEEWLISKESYINLSNQRKDLEIIEEVDPQPLIGRMVKNIVTGKEHPILPASFVDPEYASGVVFSVPGHAPADLIALNDLKNNAEVLEKYDIKEIVDRIQPINVITLKDYGEFPAQDVIESFKVENQNDPKIKDATNELYKIEHAKGTMSPHIPDYAGGKVAIVRDEISATLKEEGKADSMYDFAERPVICRCGGKCVVKIMEDQWFMKYSDEDWKNTTRNCLEKMNIIPEEVRANFEYYIGWLHDWACSRRIGLGTKIPWDSQWLIEPLTDSTIYMSYYTLAKYMKDINPDDLNDELFNKVLLGHNTNVALPEQLTKEMQDEFNYWYPLDWRLSAKDLIGNHLTFHIFHHAAIFPEDKWPKGAVVFGMGLLEGHKMSSSKGNVILLFDAIEKHGADVVRLFLMSSAEPWQDFDWREKEVKGTKRRLEWFVEFAEKVEKINESPLNFAEMNSNPPERFISKWILGQLHLRIKEASEALDGFQTRKAVQDALFLLKKDMDHYFRRIEHHLSDEEERLKIAEVLKTVLESWIRLLAPFTPHTCEELWEKYGGEGFVSNAPWPVYDEELIDENIQKAEEIVQGLVQDISEIKKIVDVAPSKIHIYLAPKWKWEVFDIAQEVGRPDIGRIMGQSIQKNVHDDKKEIAEFAKKISREMTRIKYVGYLDEYQILTDALDYVSLEAGAEISIHDEPDYDPEGKSKNAMPYKPAIYME